MIKLGRPPKYATDSERRAAKTRQAKEAKARRRVLRKELAQDKPLCNYGHSKLCPSAARESGFCWHHEKMMEKAA